jgi:hypothetical protein
VVPKPEQVWMQPELEQAKEQRVEDQRMNHWWTKAE